jgi:predicted ATPase
VIESVNRWLGPNRLATPYRLKPRPLLDAERVRRAIEEGGDVAQRLDAYVERTELLFEDLQSKTVLSHRDIGFGVGQVLPVLVGASALSGHLIAVEQPELHLHPAQQAELGDVFLESALGERKNTVLLETHSEHLILRIMRRIRETHAGTLPKGGTPVTAKDVSILFVERDGARCIVREMPLNERGELVKAWPGGFFEEGLREFIS